MLLIFLTGSSMSKERENLLSLVLFLNPWIAENVQSPNYSNDSWREYNWFQTRNNWFCVWYNAALLNVQI